MSAIFNGSDSAPRRRHEQSNVLTETFPIHGENLGAAGTLWTCVAIRAFGCLLVKFESPEPKGETLEQIENEMVN